MSLSYGNRLNNMADIQLPLLLKWSDTAGHGDSYYKVFILKGKYLIWQYDADAYGNFIYGKHKSDNGIRIYVG